MGYPSDIEASMRASQRSRHRDGKFAQEKPAPTAPLDEEIGDGGPIPAQRMKLRSGEQGARIRGDHARGLSKGQIVRLQFSSKSGNEEGEYKIIWAGEDAALAAPHKKPSWEKDPPEVLWEEAISCPDGAELRFERQDDPAYPLFLEMSKEGRKYRAVFRTEDFEAANGLDDLLKGQSPKDSVNLIYKFGRIGKKDRDRNLYVARAPDGDYRLWWRARTGGLSETFVARIDKSIVERLADVLNRASATEITEAAPEEAAERPDAGATSSQTDSDNGRTIKLADGDELRFAIEKPQNSLRLEITAGRNEHGFSLYEDDLRRVCEGLEEMRAGRAPSKGISLYNYHAWIDNSATNLVLKLTDLSEDKFALSYYRAHRQKRGAFTIILNREELEAAASQFEQARYALAGS